MKKPLSPADNRGENSPGDKICGADKVLLRPLRRSIARSPPPPLRRYNGIFVTFPFSRRGFSAENRENPELIKHWRSSLLTLSLGKRGDPFFFVSWKPEETVRHIRELHIILPGKTFGICLPEEKNH